MKDKLTIQLIVCLGIFLFSAFVGPFCGERTTPGFVVLGLIGAIGAIDAMIKKETKGL